MIRRAIARFILWMHIATLRADIAGYEEDLATIRILGQRGSKAELMIIEKISATRHELFLATRNAGPAITN